MTKEQLHSENYSIYNSDCNKMKRERCVDNVCEPECTVDNDCEAGFECVSEMCEEIAPPPVR